MPTAIEFLVLYLETEELNAQDIEALVLGTSNPKVGTGGHDLLFGTSGGDAIAGLGGNDIILSGGGDDIVAGGDGNDLILAGKGNDLVSGGEGNDFISGGAGNDSLAGNEGHDIIFGGSGMDVIHGGDGNDYIKGGADDDTLFGGNGNDIIKGGTGDDDISGNGGNDIFIGGAGADEFIVGTNFALDVDTQQLVIVPSENEVDVVLDFEVGTDVLRLFFVGPVFEISEIDTNHDGNDDATLVRYESLDNADNVIDDSDPAVILLGVTGASAEDLGIA